MSRGPLSCQIPGHRSASRAVIAAAATPPGVGAITISRKGNTGCPAASVSCHCRSSAIPGETIFASRRIGAAEKVLKAAFGDKFTATPPRTPSEDFSEYTNAGVPSMFFNIGVYDHERVDAARNGGPPLPDNHSPLFAPVPKPTIQTGVTAMTLAVLSAFNQRAKGQ